MVQEKFIETKWGKIYYLTSEKHSKVIIYFHGWLGTPGLLYHLEKFFGLLGYQVIGPYMPGHGHSFKIHRGTKFNHFFDALEVFLQSFSDKEEIIVVGFSFGGLIATLLALENPELVSKLVLINPFLGFGARGIRRMTGSVLVDHYRDIGVKNFVKRNILRRRNGHSTKGPDWPRLATLLDFLKLTPKVKSDKPLSLPTLILWGESDGIARFGEQVQYLSLFKNYSFRSFPGSHFWFHRQMEPLILTIEDFLIHGKLTK